jgi:hypothetical protein
MKTHHVRKLIKLWVAIVTLALVLLLPVLPVAAASPATVTVSAPTQPVSQGQQFTVNITVQPNNSIAGVQFSLSFNPALVSISSVTQGNLLNQGGASTYFTAGTINNAAGTLTNVAGAITTPGQTVSASGTFAVITMTASSVSGTCPLTLSNVIVGDINGNSLSVNLVNGQVINTPPSITTSSLTNGTVGAAYSQTLTATGGTTPYTWTIASGTLPAGLSLSSSGVISGTPTTASGPTSVTFQMTDANSLTATKSLSITIITPPSITTNSLPSWTVGVAYSQTLAATGGTAPYTLTITSGTLPAGLSLSSGGVISGTPTTAGGPTSITFQVTDSANKTANKSLSITINASPSINTGSLPNGTVGVAYSQTLSVTGGTSPYTWSIASGSLPAGLSFSSSGVVSGTPTSAIGPTFITFQVTDLTSATAMKSLSFTISTPPSISTSSLPNGTVGTAYSQMLTATGGTSPYSWTIASGSLPAGLTLSSNGLISGTPTAAVSSTSVTFQVTDTNNRTATKVLSMTTACAAWDVNEDGSVNVLDMTLVVQDFGQTGTPGWIREDVNGDGVINILDLVLIGQHVAN